MSTFTKIPQSTFEKLQVNAGVLLKTFDIQSPALVDANIITATTGGITATCTPTFSDWGTDVDNCPNNMKELKRIDDYTCTLAFTALSTDEDVIKLAIGAADVSVSTGAITPRKELAETDFADVWWVGDRSDGGLVAVCLKNALSTAGLTLTTTKNGKGTIAVTLTGHFSIDAQDAVPMEFYVAEGE